MTKEDLQKWHETQGWSVCLSADYFGIGELQFNNWLHGRRPIPAYVDKIIALESKIRLLTQEK